MRKTNIIVLGSLSKGKVKEFKELFKNHSGFEFKSLVDMAWNPASFKDAENGKTYYENAFSKCKLAHLVAKYPTIADDSGLEVEALSGELGVHSHRYATATASESQDEANNKKLLSALKNKSNRNAKFVCTIVFMVEGIVLSATGEMEGTLLESPRGENGFGYDPLFVPKGFEKTLAEMTLEEKNQISHRSKALEGIFKLIKEKNIQLVRP